VRARKQLLEDCLHLAWQDSQHDKESRAVSANLSGCSPETSPATPLPSPVKRCAALSLTLTAISSREWRRWMHWPALNRSCTCLQTAGCPVLIPLRSSFRPALPPPGRVQSIHFKSRCPPTPWATKLSQTVQGHLNWRVPNVSRKEHLLLTSYSARDISNGSA
jgi:hypothetical protein